MCKRNRTTKIKIIDLLNRISKDKEVPYHIYYNMMEDGYRQFLYDVDSKEYIGMHDSEFCLRVPNHHLNDTVNIILWKKK